MHAAARASFRRIVPIVLAVTCSALVAVGCGGSDGGGSGGAGATGVVGDDGPLAWLPADTWLVATANLDPDALDAGLESLGRLPIWALAESALPASDGAGLRRELLEQVAKETADGPKADSVDPDGEGEGGDDSDSDSEPRVTAKQLEAAFGNRGGLAITSTDFEGFGDDEDAPIAVWLEVDDADAARSVLADLTDGSDEEAEHEGVTYFTAADADMSYAVEDGLLVVSTSAKRIEALIDVREGDESLADDQEAAAVLETGVGDALVGVAIASQPLLQAAPDLVRQGAESTTDDDETTAQQREQAERATAIADDLGPVLESDAVDDLVADWVSASATIDETGLRMRGAWSNPRDLADPEVGSRELVERMPADAPIVNAAVSDGTMLRRVQDAWSEVRDAYDLDLRELVAAECPPADRWACDLGVELAITALEDESLADALEDAGDTSMAFTQDITPLPTRAAAMTAQGDAAPAAPKPITARLYEAVTSATVEGYDPPAELVEAATAAGLIVQSNDDHTEVTVRVRPGSPLARELQASATAESRQAFALFGIDPAALLGPRGVTFRAEEVDGLQVWGFPQEAPSKVAPALEGDVDTLGDLEDYGDVVEAVDPPDEVGVYGWVNLSAYVEGFIGAIGSAEPEAQRIIPTVRNNLADVPGALVWSARAEHDGEQVGVYEFALPILE